MSSDPLYYHSKIYFEVLKVTKKAVLIDLKDCNDSRVIDLLNYYGEDVMSPVQVWVPKSWFKGADKNNGWIWREGFMKNLEKLAEKRLTKKLEPKPELKKVPKGETIH